MHGELGISHVTAVSMSESMPRKRVRLTPMTAYQFAFYTFYQLFEAVSLDKASVWKACVVISVIDIWIVGTIVEQLGLLDVVLRHTTLTLISGGVLGSLLNYHVFYHDDRWKRYAKEFQKYSRRELIVGRILVGLFVVFCFAAVEVTVKHT